MRASNANTVDEAESLWIKGRNQSAVHHGNVGINTDVPTEALSVHGNIRFEKHSTVHSFLMSRVSV